MGAVQHHFTLADGYFAGDDVAIDYEIFADDGIAENLADGTPNPAKTMEDVTLWLFAWTLANVKGGPALLTKLSSGGITVTGIYAASRTVNTQRVRVSLADTDTDDYEADIYHHALKRMNASVEKLLSYGTLPLQVSAAPAE